MVSWWNVLTVVSLLSSVGGQFQTPYPCNKEDAEWCIDSASQSSVASACNWYRIVPPMSECVTTATRGCDYQYQDDWKTIVGDFNKSLQSDDCFPACQNQVMRESLMFSCFANVDYETLVLDIHYSEVGPQDISCLVLNEMNDCLKNATTNCAALTDVCHERINAAQYSGEAFTKCSLPLFAAATTNAPLPLLNTPPARPANMSAAVEQSKTDVGQLILIILGSIVIAATVIVIIIVIIVACRRRQAKHRRSIFKDWRPNGHKVYRDEPQYVATAQPGFRPLNYSHTSGFLNEAIVHD